MSITNIEFDAHSIRWSNLHLTKLDMKWSRNISKYLVIKQLNLSQNLLSVLHINLASHLKRCTKFSLHYNSLIKIPTSILEYDRLTGALVAPEIHFQENHLVQ